MYIRSNNPVDIVISTQGKTTINLRCITVFLSDVDLKLTMLLCYPETTINVLFLSALSQDNKVRITTKQIHCGNQTKSSVLVKSIVGDKGQFFYDGMIRIERNAKGSFATQNNKNILLASTACAVSIPNIEVLQDDVRCYHGAATGKFDQLCKLYMQAKGLDESTMKKLLIQVFCADVLDGYEKKELIVQAICEKL